jgi:hypothetical protein
MFTHKCNMSFEEWYRINKSELDHIFNGIVSFYSENDIQIMTDVHQLYDNFIDFTYDRSYKNKIK